MKSFGERPRASPEASPGGCQHHGRNRRAGSRKAGGVCSELEASQEAVASVENRKGGQCTENC